MSGGLLEHFASIVPARELLHSRMIPEDVRQWFRTWDASRERRKAQHAAKSDEAKRGHSTQWKNRADNCRKVMG